MATNTKTTFKRHEKKTQQAAPNLETKDNPKSKSRSKTQSDMQNKKQSRAQSKVQGRTQGNILNLHGITLNPEEAKKAIILAEIIGPPKSRRKK